MKSFAAVLLCDIEVDRRIPYARILAIGGHLGKLPYLLCRAPASTGGRFGVKPGYAFDAAGRSIPANMELWPGLLALALGLNLLELVMRKWKGLLEALHLAPVEAA